VLLDFSDSRLADHSAVDAVYDLAEKYADMGKTVFLRGLSNDSTSLLLKFVEGKSNLPFQFAAGSSSGGVPSAVPQ
jgi:MFS superfamily sulfate permease-like transporter